MVELISDPARQAVPTLKGYAYQIWQSLFRWVSLNDTGLLILEGAEDIDLLHPLRAETIQVKATTENITLQSTPVQEAILHYWQHHHNNPNTELYFRLLTTSERGLERSKPFGDRRGLDVWDSCKYPGSDLTVLRGFLVKQNSLPPDLLTFITHSTDEELRNQLIARIEWDTGTQSLPYIEAAVIRQVSSYGDRVFNLQQSDSEKVIPHLLNHVWNTVVKENDRSLDLPAFRRVFEDAITERIPKPKLEDMRRASIELARFKAHHGDVNERGQMVLALFTPVISDRFLSRQRLVADYKIRLNTGGLLVLQGSSGMGKSTLASSTAHAIPGAWRKLDLRGLTPEQIADRLNYAASVIEDQQERIDCLIDDINFDLKTDVYENALVRFIFAVKTVNGRIIISTQGSLPSRIVNLYELPPLSFAQVPPLDENEIKQLCINYGCAEDRHLKTWARFIYLNTRGHPQLAHAWVRGLEAKGWPAPTSQDLSAVPDIDEVRREIRTRLRDSLPSEAARLLLYRLSILTRFRKPQAISIANHSPAIQLPGEIFDSLTGPWIERVDGERFRLSPLLDNAASEVFSQDQIKELHAVAATSYLEETIEVIDFNSMLLHGLLGEAVEPLRAAVSAFLNIPADKWVELSRVVDWFAHVSVEGQKQIITDPFLNVLLRQIQFRIAAVCDVKHAAQISEICIREMNEMDDSQLHPDTKRVVQVNFLKDILFSFEVPFTVESIVDYLIQIISLLRNTQPFFADLPEYYDPLREAKMRELLNAEMWLRVVVGRYRDAATVLECLTLLAERSVEDTKEIWEVFDNDDYLSMILVDQIWLDEARQTTPNWTLCLERLQQVTQIGRTKNAKALVSASYRAKATVQEEYLKDSDAAKLTLNQGMEELGASGAFLEEYRAKALYLKGQFEEALVVWRKILPVLEEQQQLGRTYSYRDAEMCAAKTGNWREAASFALAGQNAARQPWLNIPNNPLEPNQDGPLALQYQQILATGFKADYAFALWKIGDKARALQHFAEVLDEVNSLPVPSASDKSNMLYRRVGYAISWLVLHDDPETKLIEPPAGFFSNQEVIEEVRNLPFEPVSLLWFLLAQVEYKLHLGDVIFKRFQAEFSRTDTVRERIGFQILKLGHSLRKLELSELVSQFLSHFVNLEEFTAASQLAPDSPSPQLIKLLLGAITILTAAGRLHAAPLSRWRKDVTKSGILDETVVTWLNFVEALEYADTNVLVKTVTDGSAPPEKRLAASVVASARTDIDPENRFYANVLITITELNITWRPAIEGSIADLVVRGWISVIEHERFAIKSPALHSAAILAACNDTSTSGLMKAARILLVARNVVDLQLSQSDTETLSQLSRLSPNDNSKTMSTSG